ncbi:Nitrite reductase [Actinoplanes sp. SE50]|uniref:(2Fe-2S)-binding protein n=1 Tax=unclassified Actinoplanes TaxID=2626549 RepID=UPI00023ECA1D|nr:MULTISPECIES: (2Fe-2S)-binding protein [unclassified Actinoplanes]AEV87108.1 Nitrite reductase [Actinoplanes sp. SE50/110]ATO85506.1 Nitrite reductase [Actinoplanes sp. SE50]SLM02918.1 nitrite reductase [Actinoplanes sp. SE50/110]
MNEMDDPLICICQQVSEKEIEAALAQGHCSLEAIRAATGANTGCGDCAPDIEELLLAARADLGHEEVRCT